jgi:hypothetical protein
LLIILFFIIFKFCCYYWEQIWGFKEYAFQLFSKSPNVLSQCLYLSAWTVVLGLLKLALLEWTVSSFICTMNKFTRAVFQLAAVYGLIIIGLNQEDIILFSENLVAIFVKCWWLLGWIFLNQTSFFKSMFSLFCFR